MIQASTAEKQVSTVKNSEPDQYAVFGNPIAHSKSPQIHTRFAAQTGQQLVYGKQLVEEGQFATAARSFFQAGGKGLNVTVPFKLDAYEFADSLTERARRAGAVNTLIVRADGSIQGDNTDGCGLVRDLLRNLHWPVKGQHLLLVGAGGAVRGVLAPLLAEAPASLTLVNRTVSKAQQLAKAFSSLGDIRAQSFDELHTAQDRRFDLLINGTAASLDGDLPPLPLALLHPELRCYDMMYGSGLTVFLAWAKQHGVTALADGLGMLVEQAAESFRLWRSVEPETGAVIQELRLAMQGDGESL